MTRSDTFVPFLRVVIGPRAWATVLPAVLGEVVRRGGTRAELKDALLRHCLADRRQDLVEALAVRFAAQLLTSRCRPDSLSRWDWHRRAGDTLALASASPSLYLRPFGDLLGAEHVLATGLESAGGYLTGQRSTPNCRGAEKGRRVAGLIANLRPTAVWMYTDSRSDRPSLSLADVGVRVSPFRRLVTPPARTEPVEPDRPLAGRA